MMPAHDHRLAFCLAGLAVLALALFVASPSSAQVANQPAAAKSSLTRKQAEGRLQSGYQALQQKKAKVAARELTQAIQSGKLRSKDMAKALYYRGRAYGATERPADAIADLTSALWIKGALGKKDRSAALALRQQLYAQAGVGAAVFSTTTTAATTTTETARSPTQATSASPKRATRRATVPLPTAKKSVAGSNRPQGSVRTKTAALPQTTGSTSTDPLVAVNQGVTSFFNNLFGGSPSPSSSTPNPTSAQILKGDNPKTVSSWSTGTQSSAGSRSPAKRVARAAQTNSAPKRRTSKGKYFVQVATFRTAGQAQAIANQVASKYPSALGGRTPSVEPDVLGNMGKYFFVRVRAFGAEQDTRGLCQKLLANGLDCLVKRTK